MAFMDSINAALKKVQPGQQIELNGLVYTLQADGTWTNEAGTKVDLPALAKQMYGDNTAPAGTPAPQSIITKPVLGTTAPLTAPASKTVSDAGPYSFPTRDPGLTAAQLLANGITLPEDTKVTESLFPFTTDPGFASRNLLEGLGFRTASPSPYTNMLESYIDPLQRLLTAQNVVSGGTGLSDAGNLATSDLVQRLTAALGSGGGLSSPGLLKQLGELQSKPISERSAGQQGFLIGVDPEQSSAARNAAMKLFEASQYSRVAPAARPYLNNVFQDFYDQYRRDALTGQDATGKNTYNMPLFSYLAQRAV